MEIDFTAVGAELQTAFGPQLLSIFGAIAILIVGWLVALIARAGVRKLLSVAALNRHITESTEQRVDIETAVASGVFWLVIVITLIGVFNSLNLPLISGPFQTLVEQIVGYVPRLVAGSALVLVAWLVAAGLRRLVNKVLAATQFDERLAAEADMRPMSKGVGNMLFWVVILLFLPAILGAYQVTGLLDPVKSMIATVLHMLPNIFAAFVIGAVGWLVGKVLSGLVVNIMTTAGADATGERLGLEHAIRPSRLAGTIVLILVFVPALIAALDALGIRAITGPATEMLGQILNAVPNIIAATLILTITYYVARVAAQLIAQLMVGLGLDTLPEKMGLGSLFSGTWKPSGIVGAVVLFFAMLFATVEAANRLDFGQMHELVAAFIRFGGDILLGTVILAVGFWLANLAMTTISRAGGTPGLARIAQVAILGLVIAMGLRAMGIADDVVNLAFALAFGAIAVAVALSFGLGGREAAGRQMEHWLAKLRKQG